MIFIKSLLKFSGDDFELWESINYTLTYYNVSIEGYMGFEDLQSTINHYTEFLNKLEEYLTKNHEKTEKYGWKSLYQTRAIEVCLEGDCYWVFLDPYKTTEIWDTYHYMEDVIKQLSEFKNLNLPNAL